MKRVTILLWKGVFMVTTYLNVIFDNIERCSLLFYNNINEY